ncbi:MAG: DUF58 domain-containing protein [Planctomycetes bacterium]|nr:DUF58 domain-containing protein [Planctomycetota bacterium]
MAFDSTFIKTLEYLNILARRLLTFEARADRASPRRGASIEFADYRSYVPGDEIRYIDWNVYARHGNLFVKEFTAEENVHAAILMDVSGSMCFGHPPKITAARELAAAIGYIGLVNFDTVSFYTMSDTLRCEKQFLRGKGAVFGMLEAIDAARPGGRTDFHVLATPIQRLKGRSVVVIITDFYDPTGYADGVRGLLSQKHQVHLVHVVAREELEPPERGRFFLVDLETARQREVTLTPDTLERYRGRFREYCAEVERFARDHELYYARVRSDEPLEKRIRDILRTGGILERR